MLNFSAGLKHPGAVGILTAVANSVTGTVVVMDIVATVDRRKVKSVRADEDGRNLTWNWDDNDSKNQH